MCMCVCVVERVWSLFTDRHPNENLFMPHVNIFIDYSDQALWVFKSSRKLSLSLKGIRASFIATPAFNDRLILFIFKFEICINIGNELINFLRQHLQIIYYFSKVFTNRRLHGRVMPIEDLKGSIVYRGTWGLPLSVEIIEVFYCL